MTAMRPPPRSRRGRYRLRNRSPVEEADVYQPCGRAYIGRLRAGGMIRHMISARGHNGTVHFDGQFVSIDRTGFVARATVGSSEKRIPLKSIQAIQWKRPGSMIHGYIEFTVAGGREFHGRNSLLINELQETRTQSSCERAKHQHLKPSEMRSRPRWPVPHRLHPKQWCRQPAASSLIRARWLVPRSGAFGASEVLGRGEVDRTHSTKWLTNRSNRRASGLATP